MAWTIGKNSIENLTTGTYKNSPVIFREYIQNSCDAIDAAGIFDAGKVEITIDAEERKITIEDNGTGISVLDFKPILMTIADSNKSRDKNRGFRGIGRLCGIAYCKELRFISSAKGEGIQSTMIFDAKNICAKLYGKEKSKAEDLLDEFTEFKTTATDIDEHFFRVELIDIVETNKDLLDVEKVRDYLSFVAPATYSPQLYYQELIYKHAAALNFKIAEYKILVNGEPVVKNYKTNIRTKNGADEIFGLDFQDFYDGDKLIAWSWIGLSNFKGVLSEERDTPDNKMRGIRLRAGNIQIGDWDVFKNLFKEERGTKYFIGEIHAVDTNLIPNARRDYFVENEARNVFEEKLKNYFAELHKIYHFASDVRSAQRAINAPAESAHEFKNKSATYQKSHQAEYDADLVKLNKNAKYAANKLADIKQTADKNSDSALSRVVLRMTENQKTKNPPPQSTSAARKKTKKIPPVTMAKR